MLPVDEKSKRILMVPDSLFWVTGRIACELSKELRKFSHEPIICSGSVLRDWLYTDPELVKYFDIVHFLTPHLATQFKDAFLDNCTFVSTIHHIEDTKSIEPAPYSDAIMTVSHQWHDELIKNGVPRNKLVKVQNGINTELFNSPSSTRKNSLREKLGFSSDEFVVGFSAKKTSDSCERKGIDTLSAVVRSSTKRKIKISWYIRGPGWNQLVEELRQEGARIYYSPFLINDIELAESYQALDVFLITSRIEGGPVPLLEAMSCGLPTISTRVGIALEIVDTGENGFLVDFNAPDEIFKNILTLVNSPSLVKSVSSKARETILKKLRWEYTRKEVIKLYEVAEASFLDRQPIDDSKEFEATVQLLPHNFKRLSLASEYAYFSRFLDGQGAHSAAIKMAIKSFTCAPTNMKTLRDIKVCMEFRKILSLFRAQFTQSLHRIKNRGCWK